MVARRSDCSGFPSCGHWGVRFCRNRRSCMRGPCQRLRFLLKLVRHKVVSRREGGAKAGAVPWLASLLNSNNVIGRGFPALKALLSKRPVFAPWYADGEHRFEQG